MAINFQKNISMSDFTSVGLGGKAKLFLECNSISEIRSALEFSKENNLLLQVISGGSNIIFPDEDFDGLVLKICLKGIEITEDNNSVILKIAAGEGWDDFVKLIIGKSLTGIECLSGIPGSVGATPIQNVGAYGQEVSDNIISVNAIDRNNNNMDIVLFENSECDFDYRQSRFKSNSNFKDKDKYIITGVTFGFKKDKKPEIKYPELQQYIESENQYNPEPSLKDKLNQIRNAVLALRRKKSMVIDMNDPNSKSCGSFFMNPVLDENEFEMFKEKIKSRNISNFPSYKSAAGFKIPAAWLVEQAGFNKGYRKNGVGISGNHSLALINIAGTSKDLLALADEIEKQVYKNFGIKLIKEPVIV